MWFHRIEFFWFLLIAIPVYYSLNLRWQNIWLMIASYVFYSWWDWRFLSLVLISTLCDFNSAKLMEDKPQYKKICLWTSVVVDMGMLLFFKYCNFFIDSTHDLLTALGLPIEKHVLAIILPPGISFYTFQTLSYVIDVYRGQIKACRNWVNFALYQTYFPQLVAGPVDRADSLLRQIEEPRKVTWWHVKTGAAFVLVGLFKKKVLADHVAGYSDLAFGAATDVAISGAPHAHWSFYLTGLYAFAMQIYCDFSAYSDIARGTSLWLGIDLVQNFNAPYLSRNITDFWRRWHISLSTWLRDYLYIPLGGNRGTKWAGYRNLMTTMLLGGLWHGASWAFVVWGGLHGLYLAAHKVFAGKNRIPPLNTTWDWVKAAFFTVLTFHLVCLTWIFFRAGSYDLAAQIQMTEAPVNSFQIAWAMLTGILTFTQGAGSWQMAAVWVTLVVLVLDGLQVYYNEPAFLLKMPIGWRILLIHLLLGGLLLGMLTVGDQPRPFIYFQF